MSDKVGKGGTQCGGMKTHGGERREMLGAEGTKWGFGGDGDRVVDGTKHREINRNTGTRGHRGIDVREKRRSEEWEARGRMNERGQGYKVRGTGGVVTEAVGTQRGEEGKGTGGGKKETAGQEDADQLEGAGVQGETPKTS